jgi:HAD superfamily hydrolase (TIGR01509 family)
MMLELVLFDVGGVLVEDMIDRKVEDLARRHARDLARLRPWAWDLRRLADRGELSDREYWRLLLAAEGITADDADLEIDSYQRPIAGTLELAGELRRAGRPLGILSNDSREMARTRRGRFGFDVLFDPIVISAEVRLVKPEPAIYLHAAAVAGVAPERCLFVDDRPPNVAGALAVGMRGALFRSSAELALELRDYGVSR